MTSADPRILGEEAGLGPRHNPRATKATATAPAANRTLKPQPEPPKQMNQTPRPPTRGKQALPGKEQTKKGGGKEQEKKR